MKKKSIAILGSTGSIGRQALEVIAMHPDKLQAEMLCANTSADLLIEQAKKFGPADVVVTDSDAFEVVRAGLKDYPIKVWCGQESIPALLGNAAIDMVLTAMVGFAGLAGTIAAIEAGKPIALANKESLVVAGELIEQMALKHKAAIIPVDSEHSAIFQCLAGEGKNEIEKLILTASGGPFRTWSSDKMATATPKDALNHPNWTMGGKITIDSATLMNKGLEVIEARWLFGISPEKIEVVVHPQSIIHSMVQMADGSIKAQMGLPDMRLPIQYAFFYPERAANQIPRYDFTQPDTLTFEAPRIQDFPCLSLAFHALKLGGNVPCTLNAANEIAVDAFLQNQISFMGIPKLIEQTLQQSAHLPAPTLSDLYQTDTETRLRAKSLLKYIA